MTPEEVVAKVFCLPITEVTENTSNKTLVGWDSYGHLTLILELEATYNVKLSAEEVLDMVNIATIRQKLVGHGVTW